MHSKVLSATVIGLDCELIEVEVDISRSHIPGYSNFIIVGLPDTAIKESKERIKPAIRNSNLEFPRTKVIVNLAPANIKKQGPAYDLPIAVAILLAQRKITLKYPLQEQLFIGELSLDGNLRGVNGILPIAIEAKKKNIKTIYLPEVNAKEAALIKGLNIIPVKNLYQLVEHLLGNQEIIAEEYNDISKNREINYKVDMSHIQGQEQAKRAAEIVAAGAHNLLMIGSPGAGKTLISRAIPSILPPLTLDEALEVSKIYSVCGLLSADQPLIKTRPFRSPHHTMSGVALVGGGAWPKPGEVSLAHRGILFLDELPEFPRNILENLRQPLEDGVINISRAAGTLQFPTKFILIAAMNPCPCGYANDPEIKCTCSPNQIINYQKRISGPLLDRIDLHINVPRVKFDKLISTNNGETSAEIRKRVKAARKIQLNRFKKYNIYTNSEMSTELVKKFCSIDNDAKTLLHNAVNQMHLSARAYYRILKIARTIADLSNKEKITYNNIGEALQYRPKIE